MGRLKGDLIDRVDDFANRILDVAEALERQNRSRRIVDQLTGCETSVGANVCEADEALSRKDFVKCFGTALKELGETRFWIRIARRRKWVTARSIAALYDESVQLTKILGTIHHRSKPKR
jgi:four helix bundle protein